MDLGDLLVLVASKLRELVLPFFVTGSTATITYGEPRFTNDIDLVVRLGLGDSERLDSAFDAKSFYRDLESMESAIRRCTSFNLIHPSSGLKVDFMVADDSAFNRSRFSRIQWIELGVGEAIPFASPEDVIVKKLEYLKLGGSDKHLRDIAGVLRTLEAIDLAYIESWSEALGVINEWRRVQSLADAT